MQTCILAISHIQWLSSLGAVVYEVHSILFQDLKFTTGIIARRTIFYFSQYFKVPTRVASCVSRFCKFYICMPCHYTLVSQNILLIFNKHIYTLYIVILVIYSLIWQTTTPCGWRSRHLHHVQVICTCSPFSGMALVAALKWKFWAGGPAISHVDCFFPSPRVKRWHALMPGVTWM